MKEMLLAEIKQTELHILKHLDSFCRENGLRYFLSNGTLLGAVKYKGFIPWDDDIDILMPRTDYDQLIEFYADSEDFQLIASERCHDHIFPFAKLCDRHTIQDNGLVIDGQHIGLSIDIFPLDYWPEARKAAVQWAKRGQKQLNMLGFSISEFCPGRSLLRTVAKNIIIAAAKLVGKRRWAAWLNHSLQIIRTSAGTAFMGCAAWPVYGEREVLPASIFDETIQIQFEDALYPAPAGYDIYLRSLYGAYEEDPPPEKQRSHHRFKAYRK